MSKENLEALKQGIAALTDIVKTQDLNGWPEKLSLQEIWTLFLAAGGTYSGPLTLANLFLDPQELTASGAMSKSMLQLNHATVKIEATLTQILAGHILVITQADAGTVGHTVTLASGTFDGANNTATFNAANETLIVVGIADGTGVVVLNSGAVALTSV